MDLLGSLIPMEAAKWVTGNQSEFLKCKKVKKLLTIFKCMDQMESGHITKVINKSYVKKGITWEFSIKKTNKLKLINCYGMVSIKRNSPMKPT